eukprot:scaffold87535_cov69-Phaeocystis_antarctica.AAC.2
MAKTALNFEADANSVQTPTRVLHAMRTEARKGGRKESWNISAENTPSYPKDIGWSRNSLSLEMEYGHKSL